MINIAPDGAEIAGMGRLSSHPQLRDLSPRASLSGVDAFDLLRRDGVRLRMEDGSEAPILIHQVDIGSLTAWWVASEPFVRPNQPA